MTPRTRWFLFIVVLLTWVIALIISPTITTMLVGGVAFALLFMYRKSTQKRVSETLLTTMQQGESE